MTILEYDAQATQRLVAVYVTPDVVAQREQFLRQLHAHPGERILDVGAGPGFLAEAIADQVGPSGSVVGVDISAPLVAYARAHCAHPGRVEYQLADATGLPIRSESFDAATAAQVLEYIDDVDSAIVELHRVVRTGGRIVVLDTDWDSIVWHAPDRARMDRILAAWETHAPHPRLPRTLACRLRRAGFRVEAQQVIVLFNPNYDPNTYSNRIIDLIAAFVADRGRIASEEAQAWARELREFAAQGQYFFSLNRYLFLATRVQAPSASA